MKEQFIPYIPLDRSPKVICSLVLIVMNDTCTLSQSACVRTIFHKILKVRNHESKD